MAGEARNGVVELDFGDGRHRFRLAIGELEELQEKTGIGPFLLLQRLAGGEWRTQDVRETLRLGLLGCDLDASAALKLVRRYVDERPDWYANALLARAVIQAALMGAPEEEPGKGGAPEAATEAPIFPTGASPSAHSMGPLEPPASV